ncbi:hypothetical protein A4D02_06590 [Niastella koreensis]|uniref:ATPase AAA-2 domain protein n=2 Tax=Niastella koreensis TaxID=354356 RepID=G8TG64_NIAKG|nr:SNF2-related protein [Niastella koreensis]AEW01667.1 ATPase AAA-2 domain protein [Niastella koreensis GR20-10]OQP48378.1 hypothetical protein A4D02_06590 [Niastella koreensis]
MQKELFDHDYNRNWPAQDKFPINEETQGAQVNNILKKDILNTKNFIVVTGFTSLSHIVETFGATDHPNLQKARIVVGFDIDQRISKRIVSHSLPAEIKEFWVKQGVSIKLCSAKINIIEKINKQLIDFRFKKRLHAKLYVGDRYAMLGSSNFSKSGLLHQREANIRVGNETDLTEKLQYDSIKLLAENYYELSDDFNKEIIDLLNSLLKDAIWEEALARAIAEIKENKWMKDFPILYQSIVNTELWPSQKMAIARAMSIIQDQGNVLLADPTGSGKTKLATTLAYTLFHWLGENGRKDRSNALVIAPKQVCENWEAEGSRFSLLNKIESMGKLSNSKGKSIEKLQREIEKVDILLIDEAHHYHNWKSKRSLRLRPKRSSHIILSTATPINKRAEDLLRLIELLDIDNLSDPDLESYILLRNSKYGLVDDKHLDRLRDYINQFIVRRTKKELNKLIANEPHFYKNRNGHLCKYPKTISDIYSTGETPRDRQIAREIHQLLIGLKGINYLQKLTIPVYYANEDQKRQYIVQRFNSAPALAAFEIKSSLRSSNVALFEYLYGSDAANLHYNIHSSKSKTGNLLGTIQRCKINVPKILFPPSWLQSEHHWILNKESYIEACENESSIYNKIGALCKELSGQRELHKAKMLLQKANEFGKVIAFDSTVITLDYLDYLLKIEKTDTEVIVATGQNERNRRLVQENLSNLKFDSQDKLIALCSDAMSEGINLPSAKALALLDMPSVLRIIEQRIGRLERMDSEHDRIYAFWPDDSVEFSLNGDRKIIETLLLTDRLIRGNVDIPQKLYDKYLKSGFDIKKYIKTFHEYSQEESDWQGVKDSTQNINNLIYGKNALIDKKTYELYMDIDATVKSAISFLESECSWSFFCFRGTSTRSPKWLFIDETSKTFTDFSIIAEKLEIYLKRTDIIQRKWNDVNTDLEINSVIRKLRMVEKSLLPNKKKRALNVAERLLKQYLSHEKDITIARRELIQKLLNILSHKISDNSIVDFDRFADSWLVVLQPIIDMKRSKQLSRRKVITLKDLTIKDVTLSNEELSEIYEGCQTATGLDEMISACIISVKKS